MVWNIKWTFQFEGESLTIADILEKTGGEMKGWFVMPLRDTVSAFPRLGWAISKFMSQSAMWYFCLMFLNVVLLFTIIFYFFLFNVNFWSRCPQILRCRSIKSGARRNKLVAISCWIKLTSDLIQYPENYVEQFCICLVNVNLFIHHNSGNILFYFFKIKLHINDIIIVNLYC